MSSPGLRLAAIPRAGTIIPLYEPPAKFSPAAVRYLVRMGFDDKGFHRRCILNLAVKGKN